MVQTPSPEVSKTMQHELWSCKMQYQAFQYYKIYVSANSSDPTWKAHIFTAYGNFLRHLYSFYEAGITRMNRDLLKNQGKKDTDAINHLLNEEVRKLIRNRRLTSESPRVNFVDHINGLDENEVDEEFGNHLCQIRHYFSHSDPRRSGKNPCSLNLFYKKYHKYAHILFESILFSWDSPKGLNNPEIDKFIDAILDN